MKSILTSGGGRLRAFSQGFTLAEVLITIGVIGVVAALTLPVLISNHRKQVIETRLQKFYTTFNQAILLAENKYGEVEYWDNADLDSPSGSIDWFNKYLAEFFTSKDIIVLPNYSYTRYIKLSDGSAFGMRFGDKSSVTNFDIYFFPNVSDIEYCMVNSSGSASRDCCGRKYFTFRFTPQNRLKPYGNNIDTISRETLINYCSSTNKNYCTALIMRDGWKILKSYPRRI